MNGVTNENQLTIVEEFEFDQPFIHKIDSIIDKCIRGFHNKHFHTLEHNVYDIKHTMNGKNEIVNLTIADKSKNLFELNKKSKIVQRKGLRFSEIVKLTKKVYSSLSNKNICYYLKFRILIMHRQFFRIISQNPKNVKLFRNDFYNLFCFCMSKMDDSPVSKLIQ